MIFYPSENVEVGNHYRNLYYGTLPPVSLAVPEQFHGRYSRQRSEGAGPWLPWMRYVVIKIDDPNGMTIKDLIDRLAAARVELPDGKIDIDYDSDPYGGSGIFEVEVNGTRPATTDEIKWIEWQQEFDPKQAAIREELEIKEFARKHPKLAANILPGRTTT